jgi:leucyl aminopeptidase
MINLATLTGAIMVALGQHHAGLFSNMTTSCPSSSARRARPPRSRSGGCRSIAEYDKMIDSKFADMKNTGGRYAGSITAAQFIKRFVGDTPWAHLDVAGTAMGSPSTDINQSWARALACGCSTELVRDNYEG